MSNSEQYGMSDSEQTDILDRHERVFRDGPLDYILQQTKQYQEVLDYVTASEKEVEEIIDTLNDQWLFFGAKMVVNGRAWFPCDNDVYDSSGTFVERENEILERDFKDLEVHSGGIGVEYRQVWVGGEACGTRPVLNLRVSVEGPEEEWVEGAASIDWSVVSPAVEEEYMTLSQAQYYLAGELNAVDERVFSANSTSDAIKKLRGLTFSNNPSSLPDGMTTERFNQLISEYLRHMVVFDEQVPYQLTLKGHCLVESTVTGDIRELTLSPEQCVGYVQDVYLKESSEKPGQAEVHLRTEVLINDSGDGSTYVSFPLSSLRGFVSIREQLARKNARYLAQQSKI